MARSLAVNHTEGPSSNGNLLMGGFLLLAGTAAALSFAAQAGDSAKTPSPLEVTVTTSADSSTIRQPTALTNTTYQPGYQRPYQEPGYY